MNQQFRSAEDLAVDETFQDYALDRNSEAIAYWTQFLKDNPQYSELAEEAKLLVMFLAPPVVPQTTVPPPKQTLPLWQKSMLALGGLILLIATIYGLYMLIPSKDYSKTTKFASNHNQTIVLPDMSEIELRKGSSLEFYNSWNEHKDREVWLSGEAYFDIKKDKNRNFNVHLIKGDISVLGTKFIAKTNDNQSRIMLQEGKVSFDIGEHQYVMNSGDLLDLKGRTIKISRGSDDRYDLWRDQNLVFKNTQLNQIISSLTNSFNLDIELQNKKIGERKITASVKNNDPLALLQAIAAIYEIKLIQKENKIILQ